VLGRSPPPGTLQRICRCQRGAAEPAAAPPSPGSRDSSPGTAPRTAPQIAGPIANQLNAPPLPPPLPQRDVEAAQKAKFDAQVERQDANMALSKLEQVAEKLRETQVSACCAVRAVLAAACAAGRALLAAACAGVRPMCAASGRS